MKNYEDVTNDLLERRERYVIEQRIKQKRVTGIVTSLCCVSLIFLIGIGVWQSGVFNNKNILAEDDTQHGTENYIGDEDKDNSNGDEENEKEADTFTIVSSYECGSSASCYMAPANGEFGLTEPLKNAINEYGDTAKYMVIFFLFAVKE